MKVAVFGVWHVHATDYTKRALELGEVIGFYERDDKLAEDFAKSFNIPRFASAEELLASDAEGVIVCSASCDHTEDIIKIANAKKNIFTEKVLALTDEECDRIEKAVNENGVSFTISLFQKYIASRIAVKEIADSGELGKPVHFQMKRISGVPRWSWEDWMRDKKRSGGAIIDLSVHDIDYIQYVFGQPKEIRGVHYDYKNDTEFHSSDLVYEDGFVASIIGGWYNADIPFEASFNAVFEKGNVVNYGGKVTRCGEEVNLSGADTEEDTGINIKGVDGYAEEIAYFVQCLENGVQPDRVTPVSSENAIKLAERIATEDLTV